MISASELASMQATAQSLYDQTVKIYRPDTTTDSTGHPQEDWPLLSTTTGAISQPTGSQMQNYGYVIGSLNAWQVFLPVGTDVAEDDRLVIGTQTMTVQAVLQPKSRQINLVILAAEVEGQSS